MIHSVLNGPTAWNVGGKSCSLLNNQIMLTRPRVVPVEMCEGGRLSMDIARSRAVFWLNRLVAQATKY